MGGGDAMEYAPINRRPTLEWVGRTKWTECGRGLFSHGQGFCWWATLRKSHTTTPNDDVPGSYLHRTSRISLIILWSRYNVANRGHIVSACV